jgi:hemoglobin
VHDLVVAFYREIVVDDVLGPYFDEVAEVDWAAHIPKLVDYWCCILLGTTGFAGEVTKAHRHLHELGAIRPEHCDRWYQLWIRCIDARWNGPQASRAQHHATVLMTALAKRIFGFSWSPAPLQPG